MPGDRIRQAPRYDGLAQWYDETYAHYADLDNPLSSSSQLKRLLGPGSGLCLDLACGGGLHQRAIASTGRTAIGLDVSSDQLQLARRRYRDVVRADVRHLPFGDASFPTVVCTYLHTDIDDMRPVFQEVHRTLSTGGLFVYLGVHPCFWGHFVEGPNLPDRIVHPGYLMTGWIQTPYWRSPNGLRAKVGARHATVSELVNAAVSASLDLLRLEELGSLSTSEHADRLAIVATRS